MSACIRALLAKIVVNSRPTPLWILPGIWMCALAQISTDRFLNGARRPGDEVKRASLVVKVVMKQLFVALKRLHGMGIVHRDIKPVRC